MVGVGAVCGALGVVRRPGRARSGTNSISGAFVSINAMEARECRFLGSAASRSNSSKFVTG